MAASGTVAKEHNNGSQDGRKEVIHTTSKTWGFCSKLLHTKLGANIATMESFRTGMELWEPEQHRRILIEYRRPLASTGAHELGHLELSLWTAALSDEHIYWTDHPFPCRDLSQALLTWGPDRAPADDEQLVGIQRGEPVWLSWTRGRRSPRPGDAPTLFGGEPAVPALRSSLALYGSPGGHRVRALRYLAISFSTTQLAEAYKADWLCLADGIITGMRLMQDRIVSGQAHQSKAVSFLLAMIASIRHYGHRGEPDHFYLPVSTLKPPIPWERPAW